MGKLPTNLLRSELYIICVLDKGLCVWKFTFFLEVNKFYCNNWGISCIYNLFFTLFRRSLHHQRERPTQSSIWELLRWWRLHTRRWMYHLQVRKSFLIGFEVRYVHHQSWHTIWCVKRFILQRTWHHILRARDLLRLQRGHSLHHWCYRPSERSSYLKAELPQLCIHPSGN